MSLFEEIKNFQPKNTQEENDQRIILDYYKNNEEDILYRTNEIAHFTSSGFIMNPTLDKVLLIHHNIRQTWAWTGGHADGDDHLLEVAIKEAMEETGVKAIIPLTTNIAAVDILPVSGHIKKGKYVSTHLHLSIGYVLICEETQPLEVCPDENSGVEWLSIDCFTEQYFSVHDVYLYNKLIKFAEDYKLNSKV